MKKKIRKSQLPKSVRALMLPDEIEPDPVIKNVADILYVIGVDPGTHTGVVVWDLELGRVIEWHLGDFWSAHDWMRVYHSAETVLVIEDPNKIPPTFKRPGQKRKQMEKIAGDVGKNKREASLLVKRFEEYGYQILTPSPQGLGPKYTIGEFLNKCGITNTAWLTKLKQKNHQHVWDGLRAVISQLRFFKTTSNS